MVKVMRRWFVVLSCCLTLSAAAGCKKQAAPPPESPPPAAAAPAASAGPPPSVIGMEDPFARLTGDAAKSLKAGYKAMQAKKYDEARTAFAAVVSAVPDYSPARLQEVKAAALSGHAADVPALWKELLGRDFVGYAARLDKPRELAMLRGGPEWSRIKAYEASVRPAYAADLAKGLFFIGRAHELTVKRAERGADSITLSLNQELYQFDLTSKRYRRLTETEGHVFAYAVAPERKMISFLVVGNVSDASSAAPQFSDASVGAIDLATLETIGPLHLGPAGAHAATVVMGWTGQGEPVWTVRGPTGAAGGEETNYALDATRTAVVAVGVSGMATGNRTTATPFSVSAAGATAADQVSLSDDRKSLVVADEDRTLRATRVLDPDPGRFSPGGTRLAYGGAFDECKTVTGKPEKNELYLWERGKKTAARIASAPSSFRLDWPDDDRLVYQAGAGKQARIHVLEVATKTDTVLKPRAGAALLGFSAVVCPGAAPDSETAEADEFEPEGE
jgi:hypothetical protein